jgi:hypothetical protein
MNSGETRKRIQGLADQGKAIMGIDTTIPF